MATVALQQDAEACRRFDPRPPEGWVVRQSTTRPGVFYYVNKGTGDTAVERPAPVMTRENFSTVSKAPSSQGIPNIHSIWVGRDRLLDWHQRLDSRFANIAVGYYIRFRLEDSANGKAHYKVGRIRGVTDEWRIYVDLGKGQHRADTTGIDCVSNSIFSQEEVRMWFEGLDPANMSMIVSDIYQTEARHRSLETELRSMPEPSPRKKDRKPNGNGATATNLNINNNSTAAHSNLNSNSNTNANSNPGALSSNGGLAHVTAAHGTWRGPSTPSSSKIPPHLASQTLPANAASVLTPPSPPTPTALQNQPGGHLNNGHNNNGTPSMGRTADPQMHHTRPRSRSRSRSHSRSPPPQPRGGGPLGKSHLGYGPGSGPLKMPASALSSQVLLIDEKGDPKGMCSMTDVVSRPTTIEPDTPMGSSAGFDPFVTADAGAEQDLLGTESTILRIRDIEAAEPHEDTHRPIEATTVLHMIMEAAVDGGREFVYQRPREYASAILQLCRAVRPVLEREPLLKRLSSPLYVFGDIHGNFCDLYTFMKNIISFGELNYTAADLLFLGDYVDRGTCSVECITFLLAYKLLSPTKMTLLRGNHESPEVNGDVATYGTVSFRHQCLMLFGEDAGVKVWREVNSLFRHLTLSVIVDERIFCSHGGIPQYYGGPDSRLDILDKPGFPRLEEVQSGSADSDTKEYRQFVSDLLWSDPAETGSSLNEHGFGANPRGPGIKTFGKRAVDTFLANHNFDYIVRAHQEKSNGLRLSDSARVITIFSSSDYGGHQNSAGVLLISKGKIRMAIKDPASNAHTYGHEGNRRNVW